LCQTLWHKSQTGTLIFTHAFSVEFRIAETFPLPTLIRMTHQWGLKKLYERL